MNVDQEMSLDSKGANAWRHILTNNPVYAHLLGLGPLLAISTSTFKALTLAVATLFVTAISTLLMRLLAPEESTTWRAPLLAMCVASAASLADFLLQSFAYGMYKSIGLFVPLLATHSLLVGTLFGTHSLAPTKLGFEQALRVGVSYLFLFILLGSLRELFGTGAVFADANLLAPSLGDLRLQVFNENWRFKLLEQAPGAYISLGLLFAWISWRQRRRSNIRP